MPRSFALPFALLTIATTHAAAEVSWPQFRGPDGSGIAVNTGTLPTEIGPEKNVLWKKALPSGHSSPVIHGNRIYLTGAENGHLFTLALERSTGTVLWRRQAKHHGLEAIHSIGSHAQPSPTTDGERVVVFFGSCGLLAYDSDGNELWRVPMGPFKNHFGAASSPLLVGNRVILNQDHDVESALMAFDKMTGELVWRTERSEFPRGFSTPTIWNVNGKRQIVVAGTLKVIGYDLEDGREIWSVRGLARIVNVTPVVGADGNLYVACWSPGADPGERIEVETFDVQLEAHDKNKNETLEKEEIPPGALKRRFLQIDRDKSGEITRAEYDGMAVIFHAARNVVLAIRPGGKGDVTDTHVLWTGSRMVPYVPTPIYHDGHLYMVKDGGIVSSLNAKTGKAIKQARITSRKNYYSSPILGDGKIYLLSQSGALSVISAEPEWQELANTEFGEETYATPAIVDSRIYLRTSGHLYCFGTAE